MDKRRKRKRIIAWVLVCVTFLSVIFGGIQNISALTENSSVVTGMDEMIIKGENSFGNLLASELEEKLSEQETSDGYNVFSVEVREKTAEVFLETQTDATLVVAIYEEDGEKMLASASVPVCAGDENVVVNIDVNTMPQYFYLRAFLVDTQTLRPLSIAFESSIYTSIMQEFLEQTTNDFQQSNILNLDDNEDTNFAVFADETKIIPKDTENNTVKEIDVENEIYVLENIDFNISSLSTGDIISYEYKPGQFLITKIGDIEINGTEATIIGADASMEEVFDYVKIDLTVNSDDAVVDMDSVSSGVVYEGNVSRKIMSSNIQQMIKAVRGENHLKQSHKFSINTPTNPKISGTISLTFDIYAKYYLPLIGEKYIELNSKLAVDIKASIGGSIKSYVGSLGKFEVMVYGIVFQIKPQIVLEASVKIEFDINVETQIGFSYSTKAGFHNLSSGPKGQLKLNFEGTVFVGIKAEAAVAFLDDKIAKAYVAGEVGREFKMSKTISTEKSEVVHECTLCFNGTYSDKSKVKAGIDIDAKIVHIQSEKILVEMNRKAGEFYYCDDKNEWGLGYCPYNKYPIKVTVLNTEGKPINGAIVNDIYKTEDGSVKFTLPNGEHVICIKTNDTVVNRSITISNSPVSLTVWIDNNGEIINSGGWTTVNNSTETGNFNPFRTVYEENIAAHNAVMKGTLKDVYYISACGIYFGEYGSVMKKIPETYSGRSLYLTYDANKWIGTLKSNTKYQYQLYVVMNGKEYRSEIKTFTTTEGITVTDTGTADITDLTARISARVTPGYDISEIGFYLGTTPDNLIRHSEGNVAKGSYINIWYDLGNGKWCEPLYENTTYYYKLYAISDGIEYQSELGTFSTKDISIPSDGIIRNDFTGIPDIALYQAVLQAGDNNGDGVLTVEEAEKISYIEATDIFRLRGIQFLSGLKGVFIYNGKIENINALSELTNLTELYLQCNRIEDINALEKLTNLTVLDLSGNYIRNIDALENLINLTRLLVDGRELSDINALRNLTNLTQLRLGQGFGCNINDISSLKNLVNLTDLFLFGYNISDISALENLVNLTSLTLGSNNIHDVKTLENLTNLVFLDLEGSNISDISALGNLTNLMSLNLHSDNIRDISALGNLKKLTSLSLSDSNIVDIRALENLENLTSLVLWGGNISDISALKNLKNLTDLRLVGTNTVDISALGNLKNLIRLDLPDNSISDISALGNLENLIDLGLWGNSISDISALKNLRNLVSLDLRNNYITDFTPIQNIIPNLTSFSCEGNPGSPYIQTTSLNESILMQDELLQKETINKQCFPQEDQEKQIEQQSQILQEESIGEEYIQIANIASSIEYNIASGNSLLPNETYNFYILESEQVEDLLKPNNLLYIGQAFSDDSGALYIAYEKCRDIDTEHIFVVGMSQIDIMDTSVKVEDIICTGKEQTVNPIITYNGMMLVEGRDYEIRGDFNVSAPGKYFITVIGCGQYKGEYNKTFEVKCKHQYSGAKCIICGMLNPQGENIDVYNFVKRLYTLVLGREADEGGLDSWTNVLVNHQSSGVDASYGFIFSKECRERNLSNDEFVEILYNTFMNRPSDEGGKSAWVSQLDAGVEREKIFEGFVYSQEFAIICSDYGIDIGDVQDVAPLWAVLHNYRNRNADVTKFVARCYTEALERAYETEGLESWCRVIHEKSNTPKQVAQNFIFSDEFTQKNLGSDEYVKVLYRTFMGREADEAGLDAWVNVLESGREDRAKVLEGFSDSAEFAEILQSFGLR